MVQRKVQRARTKAGAIGILLAQQAGAEVEMTRCCSNSAQFLFEKRPFPCFDGLRQNFKNLRREWIETVTKAMFPPDHELQELKRSTPKAVHLDIKDLKTLAAVWDFLYLEYGEPRQNGSSTVNIGDRG